MRKSFLVILLVLSPAFAETSSQIEARPRFRRDISEVDYLSSPNDAISNYRPSVAAYKLNTGLGAVMVPSAGVGINVLGQFGFRWRENSRFYVGPDVDFSLFNVGSILDAMLSAWQEFPLRGNGGPSINVGLSGGMAFTWQLPAYTVNSPTGYLDLSLSELLDDLTYMRFQLRPGFIGNQIVGMARVNIQFRFL